MSNASCCGAKSTESDVQGKGHVACPQCQHKGRKVDRLTVQAMLAISLEQLSTSSRFRFCPSFGCDVVYFDDEGTTFGEPDLREVVYQKQPEHDETYVCYCFVHSIGSIKQELLQKGETDVVERVAALTKAGTCACHIRNPQGSCCLRNLRSVVSGLQKRITDQ